MFRLSSERGVVGVDVPEPDGVVVAVVVPAPVGVVVAVDVLVPPVPGVVVEVLVELVFVVVKVVSGDMPITPFALDIALK
jgi:hypothetical protein